MHALRVCPRRSSWRANRPPRIVWVGLGASMGKRWAPLAFMAIQVRAQHAQLFLCVFVCSSLDVAVSNFSCFCFWATLSLQRCESTRGSLQLSASLPVCHRSNSKHALQSADAIYNRIYIHVVGV